MIIKLYFCNTIIETATSNKLKIKIMKALVKVNQKSVGMFYNITNQETRIEMHQRILDVITHRYGAVDLEIIWEY